MGRTRRIGILGGTFDPIHNGHVTLARAAARQFALDEVRFVPCGLPPHKSGKGMTAYIHRYAMTVLACSRDERFVASLAEAGRDFRGTQRHYSVDTVRSIRKEAGKGTKLYFLMGADQFLTLPSWKDFRSLARMCEFIVAGRPGVPVARTRALLEEGPGVAHPLRMKAVDVSAREIRAAVKRGGRAWKKQVPQAVAEYIDALGLYRRRAGRRGR